MPVPFSFQYAAAILSGRTAACDEARLWAAECLAAGHVPQEAEGRDRGVSSASSSAGTSGTCVVTWYLESWEIGCGISSSAARRVLDPIGEPPPLNQYHGTFGGGLYCSGCGGLIGCLRVEDLTVSCARPGGDEVLVSCHPRFTVGDLRDEVSEWLDIHFEAIVLSFHEQMLEDNFVHVCCIDGIQDADQYPVIDVVVFFPTYDY